MRWGGGGLKVTEPGNMPLAGAPLPAAKREQAVVRMTAPSAPACAATRHRKRSGRAGRPAGQHATGRQNRLVRTANRAQSAGGWMLRPACPCTRPCKRSARRPHAQMRTFSSFISMISRWAAASRSTPAPPCGACDIRAQAPISTWEPDEQGAHGPGQVVGCARGKNSV